ncbi:MAG: transglutaminase domain-containing protein [bacterium]
MIRRLLFVFGLLLPFFPSIRVAAQEAAFDTTYNIDYTVDDSLVTTVKENIAVINQTGSAVPSSFIETITNISIYDLKVHDAKDREITPEITEEDRSLIIKIPLTDPAIGQGKKTQFTISYKTYDLARKTGRILNVNIPKAPVSNYMQEYNVTVRIPGDFGPQLTVSPKPAQEKMEEEGYVLLYNKQTLEQYGISASFGDYQLFDFELGDTLQNDSFFAKTLELALPPPLKNYQEISITAIDPKPVKLRKDGDGNILAAFRVPGKSRLTVSAKGQAKTYAEHISPLKDTLEHKLPTAYRKYLRPLSVWQIDREQLRAITEPHTSALEIYTYLTEHISYDYENAKLGKISTRQGAAQTLAVGKGLCLDFTDAFIGLARAAGLPAREINGYAYTRDQETTPAPLGADDKILLHSWVQYYQPNYGWVSVDPTWGATSGLDYFHRLDNNHLAFVIKGLDPESPSPPKHIKVTFSTDEYFNRTSLYDLDSIPSSSYFNFSPLLFGALAAGLALCTIWVWATIRPKAR